MSQAIIRKAIETALNTWAGTQSLSVAWENRAFTPTNGTTYLRAFMLPIATLSQDLGREHRRYGGVFQVSVCLPVGTGPGAGEAIVSALNGGTPGPAAVDPRTRIGGSGHPGD